MPEDVARAVGAGSSTTVSIAGKQCTVRPLGIQELTEVERDCLKRYRRSYLETFSENADLIPKCEVSSMMQEHMETAAKWDIDDLPSKYAHDPDRLKMSKQLKQWVKDQYDIDGKAGDLQLRRLCAAALDQETLTDKQYRRFTNDSPPKQKVPYVNWWITGCSDGMITLVWMCFRHNGVSREEVVDELMENQSLLTDLAQEIEHLSAPAVGNG